MVTIAIIANAMMCKAVCRVKRGLSGRQMRRDLLLTHDGQNQAGTTSASGPERPIDRGQSGLVVLNVSCVAFDPKATFGLVG